MKHLFIVNPHAGAQSCEKQVIHAIEQLTTPIEYNVYIKKYKGDSIDAINEFRAKYPNEEIRIYACGGDGTLNEVAQSIVGMENVTFTSFAFGSGNDYIKYYGSKETFQDLNRLINGTATSIDMMRVNDRYALNATHFGLDYKVACTMHRLRRNILIGKQLCYPSAIAWVFLTGMTARCQVYADGNLLNKENEILLCTIANGQYVGGSYCCAPRSKNDDGLLDVCLIKPVSRLKMLQLMNEYKKGKHLSDKRFEPYITYCQAKTLTIIGSKNFGIALDGEPIKGNHFTIEVIPHAAQFVIPQ